MELSSFGVDTKKERYTIYSSKPMKENKSNRERVHEMPYPLVLIAYQ